MYERFSDRARKVMQLANQEAQRLDHDYIAPEHILVALIKEGTGIGVEALKSMSVEKDNIILDKIILRTRTKMIPGPQMTTMGKLPQTPSAKKVIETAIHEAVKLKNNYVGTEHLLLGLFQQGESIAGMVLRELGVTYDQAVLAIQELQNKGANQGTDMGKPITFAWQASVITPAQKESDEEHDAELRERYADMMLQAFSFEEGDELPPPKAIANYCCVVAFEMVNTLRQMRTTNGNESKGEGR